MSNIFSLTIVFLVPITNRWRQNNRKAQERVLTLPGKYIFKKNRKLSVWKEDKLTKSNFKHMIFIQYVLPIITMIKGSAYMVGFGG